MLPIYLTDKGWNTLICPICERELLPAYEGADGLEVAYWHDFDPGSAEQGLLVCGDFECDYAEPIWFVSERCDAVPVSLNQTLTLFEMEFELRMTAASAIKLAEKLAELLRLSGRPKLRSAIIYFRQLAKERLERINQWVDAARPDRLVSFRTAAGEWEGRIRKAGTDAILLTMTDGREFTFQTDEVAQERIQYSPGRKFRESLDLNSFFLTVNPFYLVVEGHHLHYREVAEDGRYAATTSDLAAGKALRMQQISETCCQGWFDRAEIERFYFRRYQVKIGGHWLEERGRSPGDEVVHVQTTDAEVARLLEMEPVYAPVYHEFGCEDGEVSGYVGAFPVTSVAAASWHEEIRPLPTDEDTET